jgi:hypothetical protein
MLMELSAKGDICILVVLFFLAFSIVAFYKRGSLSAFLQMMRSFRERFSLQDELCEEELPHDPYANESSSHIETNRGDRF